MSKWLARLREHEKNRLLQENGTDKIDRIPSEAISSILSVRPMWDSVNFSPAASPANDDAQAAFDERAGILEYDCGLPRDEAERLARIQVSSTLH
ncbi:hypothetical protein [Bosea sp. (in: a-proteobacteria)]|uniref:hypothetical protein n=1 Tax=Bosea sp. (in: a-proteobacteria) TaxID=1871050 RepID=UPI001AD02743|nr:hypothetical protein [Bosea sp. (in: a-proteobacteria)]MBN9440705.1 hypothetical protein [Bosea sp. (in: a-proteobacteria)]